MVDYALHRIRIEQLMRQSQKELLVHNFDDALETILKQMGETKLYLNAVREAKDNARS
jgi:hypothetical protein